jgi:hypothetical protein
VYDVFDMLTSTVELALLLLGLLILFRSDASAGGAALGQIGSDFDDHGVIEMAAMALICTVFLYGFGAFAFDCNMFFYSRRAQRVRDLNGVSLNPQIFHIKVSQARIGQIAASDCSCLLLTAVGLARSC